MTGARFALLGPFEVAGPDGPLGIPAPQLRRLACRLVLAGGRPVSRDALVDCLWPDGWTETGPADPDAALRLYASRLRKVLPAGTGPLRERDGFRLELGGDALDAASFERLLADAQLLRADPAAARPLLEEALALWRGEALGEFRDEPWAAGHAVRLEELRLAAVERLVDARLALGEHRELCGELETLVEQHPLREGLWSQLMTSLYRAGRQAEALRAFQRLRTYLSEELGIAPGPAAIELESRILAQDQALAAVPGDGAAGALERMPAGGPRHNLPAPTTRFVGRQVETAELRELLAEARLVTLAGAGGAGKTRLAVHIGAELLPRYAGGVWLVELSGLGDPRRVESAVASSLGINIRPDCREDLLEALRDQSLLLVLDNCEHLLAASAELCRDVVRRCPDVSVLATSREPLGIDGERVYRVPSLALPAQGDDDAASVGGSAAVQLFVDRARAHRTGFALDGTNAAEVASLCRRLDGIPLALEMAAARLRVLSLAQVHERLNRRFQLLVGGANEQWSRHRTLETLIDWSYDLLDPSQRRLLQHLSVFCGGFDLDAATAVLAPLLPETDVLDGVTALVDKSLLVADTARHPVRYRILETIRQYAHDRLLSAEGPAGLERLRRSAVEHYLALAERAAPMYETSEQFRWLDALDADFDNLRAAIGYLTAAEGGTGEAMRLLVALRRFFDWRGHQSELHAAIDALAGRPEVEEASPVAARYRLMCAKAFGLVDPARAIAMLDGILACVRQLDDLGLQAEVLNRISWVHFWTGEYERADEAHVDALEAARASGAYLPLLLTLIGSHGQTVELEEALQLAASQGDELGRFMALSNLGSCAVGVDNAAARRHLQAALAIMDPPPPGGVEAHLLHNLGRLLVEEGDTSAARARFVQGLDNARRQCDERHVLLCLDGLARCRLFEGDPLGAATAYGALEAARSRRGFALEPGETQMWERDVELLRSTLGDAACESAFAAGRLLAGLDLAELARHVSRPEARAAV